MPDGLEIINMTTRLPGTKQELDQYTPDVKMGVDNIGPPKGDPLGVGREFETACG